MTRTGGDRGGAGNMGRSPQACLGMKEAFWNKCSAVPLGGNTGERDPRKGLG